MTCTAESILLAAMRQENLLEAHLDTDQETVLVEFHCRRFADHLEIVGCMDRVAIGFADHQLAEVQSVTDLYDARIFGLDQTNRLKGCGDRHSVVLVSQRDCACGRMPAGDAVDPRDFVIDGIGAS